MASTVIFNNINEIVEKDLKTRGEFLFQILEEYGIEKFFKDNDDDVGDSDSFYDWLEENEWLDRNEGSTLKYIDWFSSGVTRNVIGSEILHCVLKFDIEQRCYEDYQGLHYVDFSAVETKVYELAEKKGLEKYFAKIIPIGKIYGHTFYASEYAYVDDTAMSDEVCNWTFKNFCKANNIKESEEDTWDLFYEDPLSVDYDSHEGMFAYAVEEWGLMESNQVEYFLQQLNIGDCHSGNWGRTLENGSLIITDYAGYELRKRLNWEALGFIEEEE